MVRKKSESEEDWEEKPVLPYDFITQYSIPIYTKLFPISVNSGKYSSYLLSNQIDIQLYA